MSALSDGRNWGARDPQRDGDVRDELWWQRLTGLNRDGVPVADVTDTTTIAGSGQQPEAE